MTGLSLADACSRIAREVSRGADVAATVTSVRADRPAAQFELTNLQYQLGTSFVVVTHDQEEAMTLASRIAVMDKGRFLQIAPPQEIYEYPCSRFVAEFVGTANIFAGRVEDASGHEDGTPL
jgi:ABC-type Fe3+/spermidine/putrescine transport system ATPase subunit